MFLSMKTKFMKFIRNYIDQEKIKMNWKEIYKSRLATPEEAIKFIRPGDKIVVAHGPAAPDPILQAMVDNKFAFKDVQISHMLSLIHISEPTRLGMISYAV